MLIFVLFCLVKNEIETDENVIKEAGVEEMRIDDEKMQEEEKLSTNEKNVGDISSLVMEGGGENVIEEGEVGKKVVLNEGKEESQIKEKKEKENDFSSMVKIDDEKVTEEEVKARLMKKGSNEKEIIEEEELKIMKKGSDEKEIIEEENQPRLMKKGSDEKEIIEEEAKPRLMKKGSIEKEIIEEEELKIMKKGSDEKEIIEEEAKPRLMKKGSIEKEIIEEEDEPKLMKKEEEAVDFESIRRFANDDNGIIDDFDINKDDVNNINYGREHKIGHKSRSRHSRSKKVNERGVHIRGDHLNMKQNVDSESILKEDLESISDNVYSVSPKQQNIVIPTLSSTFSIDINTQTMKIIEKLMVSQNATEKVHIFELSPKSCSSSSKTTLELNGTGFTWGTIFFRFNDTIVQGRIISLTKAICQIPLIKPGTYMVSISENQTEWTLVSSFTVYKASNYFKVVAWVLAVVALLFFYRMIRKHFRRTFKSRKSDPGFNPLANPVYQLSKHASRYL